MSAVGTTVKFPEWSDSGEPITLTGVVLSEFTEPVEEDRYQRLNYHVDVAGKVYTPYASECRPA